MMSGMRIREIKVNSDEIRRDEGFLEKGTDGMSGDILKACRQEIIRPICNTMSTKR